MGKRYLAIVALALVCSPVTAAADLLFDGPEFRVNTYTTNNQFGASVAALTDGGFVVVWGGYDNDGDVGGIFGQRFGSDGAPAGSEFLVNSYTTGPQRGGNAAAASDGGFVVVWSSGGSGADMFYSVQGQRFDSIGARVGPEFQINTYTTSPQEHPAVSVGEDGRFVVVWASWGSSGTDTSNYSVQGQRYDSAGASSGTEFQVNTYTTHYQDGADVAVHDDGSFVVVWRLEDEISDPEDFGIQGQRYDSAGAALGTEFRINTYESVQRAPPTVAAFGDSGFVAVWESNGSSGTDTDLNSVQARRYDSLGSAVGTQFQVNTYTSGPQFSPAVAAVNDGSFIVVWVHSDFIDIFTTRYSLRGQSYDSTGASDGTEFEVKAYTTSFPRLNSVAASDAGTFMVVWDERLNGSYEIFGRRLVDRCFGGPFPGCIPAERSTLSIASSENDRARSKLAWNWARGDAVTQGDLGAPQATDEYVLCIYDSPPGATTAKVTVAAGPAWTDKAPNGFSYKDKTLASSGVKSVLLRTGIDTKSRVQLKAKGENLLLPDPFAAFQYFKQAPNVAVQLVNSVGTCWTSEFEVGDTIKNTGVRFKAKARP